MIFLIHKEEDIMETLLNNNEIHANRITIALSELTSTTQFIVKTVKENLKYSDGKPTDEVIGLTVTCIDPDNFDVLKIKVPKTVQLTQEDIEKSEDCIFIEVPTDKTKVIPWRVEYGKAKVSIEAPSASIVK